MSFKFIETYYGRKFHKGQKVKVMIIDQWYDGIITSATHYIYVKCDHAKNIRYKFHPTDDQYIKY